METKRLFIGGLFSGIKETDLKDRIGKFGSVSNIELKTRKSEDGEPVKTFAHLDLESSSDSLKKCMATYNGCKWKGSTLSIQVAKENFLDRLKKERVKSEQKEDSPPEVKKPKVLKITSSKPGDPVPGEDNWVVGKFGRALPIVNMRRKDGKKIITVDPSKYCHSLKVMKDAQPDATDVNHLTWEMEEKTSEIDKKKMGQFPASKKKKKKSLTGMVNADVLREVEEAELTRLEKFEVVSHMKVKSYVEEDDGLDSDDTDDIIAMKRPGGGMAENYGGMQQPKSSELGLPMETSDSDSDSGVEASQSKRGQKYSEKVMAVSKETDEIILTSGPSLNGLSNQNFSSKGEDMDSDASTDIDDILSRIETKQKKMTKRQRDSSPRSSDSENDIDEVVKAKKHKTCAVKSDSIVKSSGHGNNIKGAESVKGIKKTPKSEKKVKKRTISKSVQKENAAFESSDDDDAEIFQEPKQGNLSWTQPVKRMKMSSRDIVSFDDTGGVVNKQDEADGMDSAGSADTDELFFKMAKRSVAVPKFGKSPCVPKITPAKGKPNSSLSVSILDEFASGFDDLADVKSSKQESDSSDSDSDESDSDSIMKPVGQRGNTEILTTKPTNLKIKALNSSKLSATKNSSKNVSITSDSDDEFVSCESDMDSELDSLKNSKKSAEDSVSKMQKERNSSLEETSDSDNSQTESDSEPTSPPVSEVKVLKEKTSAPELDSSDSEAEEQSSDSDSENIAKVPVSKVDILKTNFSGRKLETIASESDEESSDSDSENISKMPVSKVNVLKSKVPGQKLDTFDSESEEDSSDSDSENISKMPVSKVNVLKSKVPGQKLDTIDSESEKESTDSDSEEVLNTNMETPGLVVDFSDSDSDAELDSYDSSGSDIPRFGQNNTKTLNKKSMPRSPYDSSSSSESDSLVPSKQNDVSNILEAAESSDSSEEESEASAVSEEVEIEMESSSESEENSDAEIGPSVISRKSKEKVTTKTNADSKSQQTDVPDPATKPKKDKKKNKDKTTKNISKSEKHKSDNLKRMETFQLRRQENQGQKTAIREALAAVDSGKTKGKKTVFSSDSDSDDATPVKDSKIADKKTAAKTSSLPRENVAKGKKAKGLFDSDSEEEMEEGLDDDETFRIRPQFEGKAGKKLLRLQRRYGDDERFKMDEKFLGDDSDDDSKEKVPPQPNDAGEEKSERDRQIELLKDMFGSRAIDAKVAKKPAFQNASSVHYDPTREDHSQFEVQVEPKKTEKKKKKKKGKEEESEEKKEPELPEVSKERFYEVSTNLKDIFEGNKETSTFSFLTPELDEGGEKQVTTDEPESCQPSNLLPWQAETFNYDTSSGEEEEDDRVTVKKRDEEPKKDTVNTNLFFFTLDDERIKEGVESFHRKEDMSVVRQDWWEKRPALVDSYRMRRKRALRKQRHEKAVVPPHIKAKGKWK